MKKNDDKIINPGTAQRLEKVARWNKIYHQALDVIEENLGDVATTNVVYSACQTITTASRELQIVERIMVTLGEIEKQETPIKSKILGWDENLRLPDVPPPPESVDA